MRLTPETAMGAGGRGYGQCHRKKTAGDASLGGRFEVNLELAFFGRIIWQG